MKETNSSKVPPLDEIWSDDLLLRRNDAEYITRFLVNRVHERIAAGMTGSYVLNIDARWGQGKTFFLTRLQQHLSSSGHIVAYVNAWEDDHATDPLVPVIHAIDKSFDGARATSKTATRLWKAARSNGLAIATSATSAALRSVAKKYLGDSLVEVGDAISDTAESVLVAGGEAAIDTLVDRNAAALIAEFENAKSSIEKFRQSLKKLGEQSEKLIFILIDEMDRCRPNHAVALLERIKHLFTADRVIFIVATDTEQLQHAVGAVYGLGFDSTRYLSRFFDRTYMFAQPELAPFVSYLFTKTPLDLTRSSSPDENHEGVFRGYMEIFDLSLRDAEQCIDLLSTVLTIWPFDVPAELVYLIPLIVTHQQGQLVAFEGLSRGNPESLKPLIKQRRAQIFKFNTDVYNRPFEEKIVDVELGEILDVFLSHLNTPLRDIGKGNASGHRSWVQNRFNHEYNRLHGSTHFGSTLAKKSVLLDYHLLVRSAGRFYKLEIGGKST